jgi:hypothetical protein
MRDEKRVENMRGEWKRREEGRREERREGTGEERTEREDE